MRQEKTKADLFFLLTHAGGELVLLVGLAFFFFLPLNRRVSSCSDCINRLLQSSHSIYEHLDSVRVWLCLQ